MIIELIMISPLIIGLLILFYMWYYDVMGYRAHEVGMYAAMLLYEKQQESLWGMWGIYEGDLK